MGQSKETQPATACGESEPKWGEEGVHKGSVSVMGVRALMEGTYVRDRVDAVVMEDWLFMGELIK